MSRDMWESRARALAIVMLTITAVAMFYWFKSAQKTDITPTPAISGGYKK